MKHTAKQLFSIGIFSSFLAAAGITLAAEQTKEVGIVDYEGDEIPDVVFVLNDGDEGEEPNMNLYGFVFSSGSVVRLTDSPASEMYPIFSPQGTSVAYLVMQENGMESRLLDLKTGSDRRLKENLDIASWSPDGSKIATSLHDSEGGNKPVIFDVASGKIQDLNIGKDQATFINWSPNGDQFAFESAGGGDPEIFVANADGTGVTQLTDNTDLLDEWPQWSPDGKWIAYASGTESDKDLWVMSADGSNKRQLTKGLHFGDAFPAWSPDNSVIILAIKEDPADDNRTHLILVDVNTGSTKQFIPGAMAPTWRNR